MRNKSGNRRNVDNHQSTSKPNNNNKSSYLPVAIVAGVIATIFFIINVMGFVIDMRHDIHISNYISTSAIALIITVVVGVPAIIIIPGIVAITIRLKNSSRGNGINVVHNKRVTAIRVLASVNMVMLALLVLFSLAGASSDVIGLCVHLPTFLIGLAILILAFTIKNSDFPASVFYQDIVRVVALLLYRREFLNYLNSISFYYHYRPVPYIGAIAVLISYLIVVKFESVFPPFARIAYFVCEAIILLGFTALPQLLGIF